MHEVLFFYLYIFFFILWSLRNWSEYFCYIFGILRIWVLTLVFKVLFEGGNLISIHLLYFNISSGILLRFGRKYKISDFFKEKKFLLWVLFVEWVAFTFSFHFPKFNYMCHIIQAIVVLLSIHKYTVSVDISLCTG